MFVPDCATLYFQGEGSDDKQVCSGFLIEF